MRRIRYSVATSLDGFIAGPNGEADWILMDPEIDFGALFGQFDTMLIGRGTFEAMNKQGGGGGMPGMKAYVFSRTLKPKDHPKLTIVGDDAQATLAALKEAPGKDIWLFGGGGLFRSLLDMKMVDTVEVAVIPVLLGAGVPLLSEGGRANLRLTSQKVLKKTGTLLLEYDVDYGAKKTKRR